jgi:multisubunit Na+/H+ antiporter MnhB subunit
MPAVLTLAQNLVAPTIAAQSAPDSGLTAAVITAAGVTALVALGLMVVALHRSARLTAVRGAATVALGLGVIAVAALGIVAVSPGAAQATTDDAAPLIVPAEDGPDLQLPTLPLD